MILHDDPSGTIAHGILFVFEAPLPPGVIFVSFMSGALLQKIDQLIFSSSCWNRSLSYDSVSICGIGKSGSVSSGRTTTQNGRRGASWLRPPS